MNMNNMKQRLDSLDWPLIGNELHDKGFVIVKNVISDAECKNLIADYEQPSHYRKTIKMERYRFGVGEYKYFQYPLPEIITDLRGYIYPHLVPVANEWMKELNINKQFPETHREMLQLCRDHDQNKPTVLILKYGEGGFNTLHQDLYGDIYFPMQVVFMLDQIDKDYKGGEFVITEQIPRAQSKANVLKPDKGDMVIFTTQTRPQKGTKGYYRVNMRHGISPLQSGTRHSMGIIFHDGLN